ncbi:hypothetical protein N2600_04130 [Rhizobium sp. WSM1274]|uniref:hypothetical protein n=1 Tax=Rhizobium sp. WSM1274 TaxID=3138254 RepID=UPI0021A8B6AF|nr:hypothetical protein [Rhizobium leguminosarum]UWU29168.1 hypothetical protein N2600_04130 [Rhizobium leguminosarum bv. viciae]
MFTLIVDYAVAPDGGSLALSVERLDGKTECFVINRSFASRGTPDYNVVKSTLRSLSQNECEEIANHLGGLVTDATSIDLVADFIKTLKAQSSKVRDT